MVIFLLKRALCWIVVFGLLSKQVTKKNPYKSISVVESVSMYDLIKTERFKISIGKAQLSLAYILLLESTFDRGNTTYDSHWRNKR